MTNRPVRFDETLVVLAKYLLTETDIDPSSSGVFLRDGFGKVAFCIEKTLPTKTLRKHVGALSSLLGSSAFIAGALQDGSGVGASIATDQSAMTQLICVDGQQLSIRIVDRRFFGRDWLETPIEPISGLPPLLTFGSMKGGVGRTTALFVLAIHLAGHGKNVLLVDLDLEAPGLASLLFEGEERPRFGVLDYLVENGLGGVDGSDVSEFVGTSRLTDRDAGQGRVDLAPATGMETIRHPQNMLAKLARALVEDPTPSGAPLTLASQIREMVQQFSRRSQYDAILIDARSGLAELSAGPLLGLGGNVLLFATDHPHTFESYRYMMAHLGTLPVPTNTEDWRERIHFIHSLASPAAQQRQQFDDKLYELLAETFYEKDIGPEVFNYSLDEYPAPHHPPRLFFDQQFLQMNPIADRSILEADVYKAAYGSFLDFVMDLLGQRSEAKET